jgi:hypothetical protein
MNLSAEDKWAKYMAMKEDGADVRAGSVCGRICQRLIDWQFETNHVLTDSNKEKAAIVPKEVIEGIVASELLTGQQENYDKMLACWTNVCASDVFQEFKHGRFRHVLHLLANGYISVGKAAQVIAELAHSGESSEHPELNMLFDEDVSWRERFESASEEVIRLKKLLNDHNISIPKPCEHQHLKWADGEALKQQCIDCGLVF